MLLLVFVSNLGEYPRQYQFAPLGELEENALERSRSLPSINCKCQYQFAQSWWKIEGLPFLQKR